MRVGSRGFTQWIKNETVWSIQFLIRNNHDEFHRLSVPEAWIHNYTSETKQQSKELDSAGELAPKKWEDEDISQEGDGPCLSGLRLNYQHKLF